MLQTTPHRLEFMRHGQIPQEVRSGIEPSGNYSVVEVFPNGQTKNHVFHGEYIRKNYGEIFSDCRHGFIVAQSGSNALIFAYNGPVSGLVSSILQSSMLH